MPRAAMIALKLLAGARSGKKQRCAATPPGGKQRGEPPPLRARLAACGNTWRQASRARLCPAPSGICPHAFVPAFVRTHVAARTLSTRSLRGFVIFRSSFRHVPRRGAIGAASQGVGLRKDAVQTGDQAANGRRALLHFAKSPRPDPPDRPRPAPLFP